VILRALGRAATLGLASNKSAIPGAVVEIGQCDAFGRYRHPRDRRDGRDPRFQGRGRVGRTGPDGAYAFRTIRPLPYPGRTPHLHVAVAAPGRAPLVTQIYVAGEPLNERDGLSHGLRDPRQRRRCCCASSRPIGSKPVPCSPAGTSCSADGGRRRGGGTCDRADRRQAAWTRAAAAVPTHGFLDPAVASRDRTTLVQRDQAARETLKGSGHRAGKARHGNPDLGPVAAADVADQPRIGAMNLQGSASSAMSVVTSIRPGAFAASASLTASRSPVPSATRHDRTPNALA
jgi:intradiol ring-cleaving dioxygenase-like protein